jgi:hypothetical protein
MNGTGTKFKTGLAFQRLGGQTNVSGGHFAEIERFGQSGSTSRRLTAPRENKTSSVMVAPPFKRAADCSSSHQPYLGFLQPLRSSHLLQRPAKERRDEITD